MSICSAESVYEGHSNVLTLVPFADVVARETLDMSGATRVDVCIGAASYSSDENSSVIWWEKDDSGLWVIRIRAGLIPGIVAGEQDMRVVAFDSEYTEGLVLVHDYPVEVISAC